MYFGGAMVGGVDEDTRTVTPHELASLHSELVNTVVSLRAATESATHPVRYARLLQLDALLALHPAYGRMRLSAEMIDQDKSDHVSTGAGTTSPTQATSGFADESGSGEPVENYDEYGQEVKPTTSTPPGWPTPSGQWSCLANSSTCFPGHRRSRSRSCRGGSTY
jgi:hypothetical protein